MRITSTTVSLIALAVCGAPAVAAAADAAPVSQGTPTPTTAPEEDDADDFANEIIVTATRLPGQVDTDVPPVLELAEADIAAYGASSIDDLISQLSPQTGSGRGRGGRPVFLVNGQRIANFREFRRYPPEAIRKVEVLPEEVALKFGYPADARVVNFILKSDFANREIEAEYGMPTQGGTSTGEVELSMLRIAGPNRFNASAEYTTTTPLTEGERGVVQADGSEPTVATDPNPADYRTLVAKNQEMEGNLTWTRGLGKDGLGGQFTINGQVTRNVKRSLSGLDTVLLTDGVGNTALRTLDADPITRRTTTDAYSVGSSLALPLGAWQFQTTLDATRTDTDSQIDRRRDTTALVDAAAAGTLAIDGDLPSVAYAGQDRALSKVYSVSNKTTLIGNPITLPAGDVSMTLTAGYDWTRIDSTDTRTTTGATQLTRGDLSGGINIGVPISSTRNDVLAGLGDISLNLSGGIDHLSDFGTLTNWTTGINWRPTERLGLQASYIVREAAPGLSQLGNPTVIDYNVPVYDFTNGTTVLATVTSGGNPNLTAETQRDWKLSANYDIDLFDRTSFRVEYFSNHSTNTTNSFPVLTPAIEAAFPDRVTRAADGTLLAIDQRPVTFAEENSSRIRYGVNLFGRFGKAKEAEPSGDSGGGRGTSAPAPASPPAGEAGPPPGGQGAGGPRSVAAFDPSRFAAMRAQFCGTPEGQVPDISQLPERMQERLKGEDGNVDPAKVAQARERICSADGANPRPQMDPARFEKLRIALCPEPGKEPDLTVLPERVLERLKGPDGQVDPARLKALQQRLCSMTPPSGAPAGDAAKQGGQSGNGARGGSRGGGVPGFGRGDDGRGRWNLSLYHTVELTNRVLIAPGGPELDMLNGDATGSGGTPRHKLELEGGLFRGGIGGRLSANYQNATTVNGSGLPGSSDLRFGSLTTFNLRVFMDLAQQDWLTGGGDPGFWKGWRMSLRADNLFDTRQKVTDSTGTVPLRYQPALIDPVGRFVEIEFRKVF
ncbi:hypothetical protein D6858_05800 [Tsuneonella suprasediminis]|uniref:TonB-dependent receptor n=1 Tax=Tsuneonella suprasediminis TaxID=2306996 RepID=A0A419R2Y8_9SPHN|nr:hypothetical protein [Tsuneonella suprasediminis]RJX68532.1 hypothetical protein D6858_05800 [Tsuneonella suprasediminis]